MLILSRRNGESFIIGDDIKITVLSQRSNQVRIGIDAPRDLPVFREEVLNRQKQTQSTTESTQTGEKPNEENTSEEKQKQCEIAEELTD